MQNELTGQDIPTEKLGYLAKLANEQLKLERQITTLEKQLDDLKETLNNVSTVQIPSLMEEIGLSEFKLKSGEKIAVAPFFSAKIADEHKDKAYEWLENHGHGGLIKTEVEIRFDKGELAAARTLAANLAKQGLMALVLQSVHHMTLKSFVREMCTNPDTTMNFPRELFGVFEGKKTTIKQP